MLRWLIALLLLGPCALWACEDPLARIATRSVEPAQRPAHLAHFRACFDEYYDLATPEQRHRLITWSFARALRRDDVAVVGYLISLGLDVDVPASPGRPRPIMAAARSGRSEIISLLLDAGADPDGITGGESALVTAISNREAEAARLLWRAGGAARLHPNRNPDVSLMEIAAYGAGAGGPTFELLIEMGEDPNQPYLNGSLPLHVAAALGQGDVVRALVKGGPIWRRQIGRDTARWSPQRAPEVVLGLCQPCSSRARRISKRQSMAPI